MKIVVLDGYTLNPGDISWEGLEALGECVVYDLSLIHILLVLQPLLESEDREPCSGCGCRHFSE